MTERPAPCITLNLEPENTTASIPRPKTVQQLLNRLGIKSSACLVIKEPGPGNTERTLLTPDLRIYPDDVITVRKVTSSG